MKKIFFLSFIVSLLFVSQSYSQWWTQGGNLLWPYGDVSISKNLNVSGSILNENVHPYKVYVALLSQSGSDAPTAIVLENTLGDSVTWSYVAPGLYHATCPGKFFITNTFPIIYFYHAFTIDEVYFCHALYTDVNIISVYTRFVDFTVPNLVDVNGALNYTPIEIRVYP